MYVMVPNFILAVFQNCLEWTCKHQGHDDTPEEISEISSIAGAIFGAISLMITCMYILMKKFKWRIGRRGLYRKLSEEVNASNLHFITVII